MKIGTRFARVLSCEGPVDRGSNWALHYLEIKQKTTDRVESGNVVCLSKGSVCAVRSATLLMDQHTCDTYMAEYGGVEDKAARVLSAAHCSSCG
jgi:hypothetical protein